MTPIVKLLKVIREWHAFRPALSACVNEFLAGELSRLANLYGSDKGLGAHNYSRIYESVFKEIRYRPLLLLEIGLLKHSDQAKSREKKFSDAPSMSMWIDYFPNAEVIGFDIADFSNFRAPRCTIIRGDQSKREDLLKLTAATGGRKFDIIIDDALHAAPHQQITLATLFPHLADDGYYFIEDLHFDPLKKSYGESDLTVNVLADYVRTGRIDTRWLSDDERAYLSKSISSVDFFESFRRDLVGKKCLACLRKS